MARFKGLREAKARFKGFQGQAKLDDLTYLETSVLNLSAKLHISFPYDKRKHVNTLKIGAGLQLF